MDIGAIVLCGGESRRMGRPKAWLRFGPERLLQRVVRLVGLSAAPVVVVTAPGQDLPTLRADVAVVSDTVSGRGPVQGLAAGLLELEGRVELAFVTAVDVPFLVPGWVGRLAALIGDADLAIPRTGPLLHPLSALYRPATVRTAVEAMIVEGRFRAREIVKRVRTREVGADDLRDVDPDLDTLANLNTPDDYRAALLRAGFPAEESE
jgi:molybdopterin-guanine dinucleotide biosynthesis protein A